jgi:hypothetical protein
MMTFFLHSTTNRAAPNGYIAPKQIEAIDQLMPGGVLLARFLKVYCSVLIEY